MQFTSIIRCQKSFDGGKTWGEADVIFPQEGKLLQTANPGAFQWKMDLRKLDLHRFCEWSGR